MTFYRRIKHHTTTYYKTNIQPLIIGEHRYRHNVDKIKRKDSEYPFTNTHDKTV